MPIWETRGSIVVVSVSFTIALDHGIFPVEGQCKIGVASCGVKKELSLGWFNLDILCVQA
jgi:hypothetical protein